MAVRPSDRAVRRMVVRLKKMPASDFDVVFDSLDPEQRQRVLELLSELGAQHLPEVDNPSDGLFQPVMLPPGLSPWLAARVNGSSDAGDETIDPFVMSKHAQKAIRSCAAAMTPQPAKTVVGPSLMSRIWQGFA